ncbi:Uncharacterized protein PCOAH_00031640 [Plasmodium coatneyi]|uniref:Skeleton-binding protein 1 n=1 Tax=Plasmodium coatneyi TaxID=208452 RepID=A0A1B1E1C4_9APIC|nr:Uncharacterized protein PCOAH_00031640 [Plasmodium coatneyi]ANQ08828.1 Uncharacterized protein PCOAH_00031640 [Plasmodium coatneyi]
METQPTVSHTTETPHAATTSFPTTSPVAPAAPVAPQPAVSLVGMEPVSATEHNPLDDVHTDEEVVDIAHLSDDVVADLAALPEEHPTEMSSEETTEMQADSAETTENAESSENADETISAPPNLDEMFSEESIRKLRESIENSPCYQRRLAAYREQQERLGKSIDIGPSSNMISPIYKLQFFGSYVKGMIHLIQNNYVMLLLIGLFLMNGVLFYNYYKGASCKKKSKEEKLKKKMKQKCKKLEESDEVVEA